MIEIATIVIGGAHGIGRACVEEFRAEGPVWVLDIDAAAGEELARDSGNGVRFVPCDARGEAEVEAAARAIAASGSAPARLVYTAGIAPLRGFGEVDAAIFRDIFETNVLGAALCVKHLAPLFPAAGGSVVFVSSVSARVGFAELSLYCASKAALGGLARGLVPELARHAIRINVIEPTMVETRMMEGELRAREALGQGAADELAVQFAASQPIPRFAKPAEIARLCRLVCDGSLGLMTGAAIPYDGGLLATR